MQTVKKRSTVTLFARLQTSVAASAEVLQLIRTIEQTNSMTTLQHLIVLRLRAAAELNRLSALFAQNVTIHQTSPETVALAFIFGSNANEVKN
jgi:hypothetical protein